MMATDPLMILSPAMEAQQLLDDAAEVIAGNLAEGIANLGYPVGMGMAPHPTSCRAAADKIVRKFAGAVLAAVEFEREIAVLGERQAREDAMRAALEHVAPLLLKGAAIIRLPGKLGSDYSVADCMMKAAMLADHALGIAKLGPQGK